MARSDYTPERDELAALLRARLRQQGGTWLEEADARGLSGQDADQAILAGVRRVAMRLGDVHEDVYDDAKQVVLYQAAANLETSTVPEQTRNGQSPREFWQKLADDALKPDGDLVTAQARAAAGDLNGDGAADGGVPQWGTEDGGYVAGAPW